MVSPGGVGSLFLSCLTTGGGVGSRTLSTFLRGGETLQSSPPPQAGGGGGGQDMFYSALFKFLFRVEYFFFVKFFERFSLAFIAKLPRVI